MQVRVLLFRPPWLARLSDITDDGNTSSQFRRGRPLLVNKAHPKPASGLRSPVYKSTEQRPSSLRIEPRGVKSDEMLALWEETSPPIKVVLTEFEIGKAVHTGVVTAGVWRPKSARRERARLGDERGARWEGRPAAEISHAFMVHYPNWQRETAQTRLSFGSNPK